MKLFDYEKAMKLMSESGIDIVLASSKHNIGYLADYWHSVSDDYYVLWDTTVTHKTLVGIPREEKLGAFMIPAASEMTPLEAADPWIKERRYWGPGYYIQTWKEKSPDPGNPMDVVAEALAEKGLNQACLAVEMRYLGIAYFERLRSLLPKARFVDAEGLLWNLRMIKCSEEIRRTREACRRTTKAWYKVINQCCQGITERKVQHLLVEALAEEELEYERAYCIFGPAGVILKNGPPLPSDNRLREGQFIRTDVQARYEGYMCNLSRVVAFGRVTIDMEKAHTIVKDMLKGLTVLLKPGISCRAIRMLELEMYQRTCYKAVVPYTGHGIGRVVHEPPYLSDKDHTLLTPGMLVTLEPTVNFSNGGDIFVCLEDEFLITEDGCECLTCDASLELYP